MNDRFFTHSPQAQAKAAQGIKRAPEDRYTTLKAMQDLRNIWFSQFAGTLSTIYRDELPLASYPAASVVPYVLDDAYRPVVLIGHIAEHTQNALHNPKACLFMREHRPHGDVQNQWRLSAIGDLLPVPEEEIPAISTRYFAHYPQAQDYDATHHFSFFRLHSKKFRIIMGFGDIRWVSADAPFSHPALAPDICERIITHMNEDHHDAMRGYLRHLPDAPQNIPDDAQVLMTAVNPYGCTLKYGDGLYFQPFEQPATDANAVRDALVALAQAHRD